MTEREKALIERLLDMGTASEVAQQCLDTIFAYQRREKALHEALTDLLRVVEEDSSHGEIGPLNADCPVCRSMVRARALLAAPVDQPQALTKDEQQMMSRALFRSAERVAQPQIKDAGGKGPSSSPQERPASPLPQGTEYQQAQAAKTPLYAQPQADTPRGYTPVDAMWWPEDAQPQADTRERWIPVSEKPNIYEDVLLWSQHGAIGIGKWLGHDVWSHPQYPVLGQCSPSHWMPLPPPPEGK